MGTIANARAASPNPASTRLRMPSIATARPMNSIAVASEMPNNPQARCVRSLRLATSIACDRKNSVHSENSRPWRWSSGEPVKVPRATCSQYVPKNPPNAIATKIIAIVT